MSRAACTEYKVFATTTESQKMYSIFLEYFKYSPVPGICKIVTLKSLRKKTKKYHSLDCMNLFSNSCSLLMSFIFARSVVHEWDPLH